jgi:hypothetical protein
MNELTKRIRGGRRERGGHPGPAVSAKPLRVEITLPGQLHSTCAAVIEVALNRRLKTMLSELGLRRDLQIAVKDATDGVTLVNASLDDRPVALLACVPPAGEEPAADILRGVMTGILRRLTLLAGADVAERSDQAYLTTIGCCAPAGTTADSLDVDTAEGLINRRTDEAIRIEVAAATIRRVDPRGVRAMIALRENEFRKRGLVYPDVRVDLTDRPPGSIRLRFNDVTLPASQLGEDAGWSDVIQYLGRELAVRRHWFVRMRDVSSIMTEDLALFAPDLVAVSDSNYSLEQTTACLRELGRSVWRTRNLSRILWLLLEQGGSPAGPDVLRLDESPLLTRTRHRQPAERDPMVMAVRVRKLVAEERWRLGTYSAPRHPVRLSPDIEQRLVDGDQREG